METMPREHNGGVRTGIGTGVRISSDQKKYKTKSC